MELYEIFANLSKDVFDTTDLDIPINEIPVLLEPLDDFLDLKASSPNELASRQVSYSHYAMFKKRLFGSNSKVTFMKF